MVSQRALRITLIVLAMIGLAVAIYSQLAGVPVALMGLIGYVTILDAADTAASLDVQPC